MRVPKASRGRARGVTGWRAEAATAFLDFGWLTLTPSALLGRRGSAVGPQSQRCRASAYNRSSSTSTCCRCSDAAHRLRSRVYALRSARAISAESAHCVGNRILVGVNVPRSAGGDGGGREREARSSRSGVRSGDEPDGTSTGRSPIAAFHARASASRRVQVAVLRAALVYIGVRAPGAWRMLGIALRWMRNWRGCVRCTSGLESQTRAL